MAFHHCVHGKFWSCLFLLDPAPFAFLLCFSAGWRSAYLAGGSAFRLLWFVFVVFCAVDLPSYMTTGVNVDVILNCFFSYKNRASERDRPYQRKKKSNFSWAIFAELLRSLCQYSLWSWRYHLWHISFYTFFKLYIKCSFDIRFTIRTIWRTLWSFHNTILFDTWVPFWTATFSMWQLYITLPYLVLPVEHWLVGHIDDSAIFPLLWFSLLVFGTVLGDNR